MQQEGYEVKYCLICPERQHETLKTQRCKHFCGLFEFSWSVKNNHKSHRDQRQNRYQCQYYIIKDYKEM